MSYCGSFPHTGSLPFTTHYFLTRSLYLDTFEHFGQTILKIPWISFANKWPVYFWGKSNQRLQIDVTTRNINADTPWMFSKPDWKGDGKTSGRQMTWLK